MSIYNSRKMIKKKLLLGVVLIVLGTFYVGFGIGLLSIYVFINGIIVVLFVVGMSALGIIRWRKVVENKMN